LADVRARIEQRPLAQAKEAYDRMRSGQATFRMVLTVNHQ
ncbi:MAG TPA: alcohol dehydrogenase, partial [Enterobacteriaceae bacterium]|nr:alcohol dehydrogenase [Enterobacteriaceae bacterium]